MGTGEVSDRQAGVSYGTDSNGEKEYRETQRAGGSHRTYLHGDRRGAETDRLMGKGMGLTSTRKGKDSGKWQRDDPPRDRRAAGTDRPWTNPLNLHGDRRRAGTDRRTGRGHRGDPEKEKECRDRWTGRSHRYER